MALWWAGVVGRRAGNRPTRVHDGCGVRIAGVAAPGSPWRSVPPNQGRCHGRAGNDSEVAILAIVRVLLRLLQSRVLGSRRRWLGRCHGPDSRRAARVVSILAGTEKAVAFEWVADLLDLELVGRSGVWGAGPWSHPPVPLPS